MPDNIDPAIDFIANAIYVAESREQGYEPWAWRVLKPEDREKYVLRATDLVSKWVEGENEKEIMRNRL